MKLKSSLRKPFAFLCMFACLYILNYMFINDSELTFESTTPIPTITPCPSQLFNVSSFPPSSKINCDVDQSISLQCVKENEEVYFPFSFLKKQFDVTGKFKGDCFEWSTSYSKMRLPSEKYDSMGVFGHFATYNVETRERVRCINPLSGMPMSTQWSSTPYYYPIQIAQYGLQHYSRLVSEQEKLIEQASGKETREWKGAPGSLADSSERIFFSDQDGKQFVNVSTSGDLSNPGAYVGLSHDPLLSIISFSFLPYENASFTFLVSLTTTQQIILLHYVGVEDSRCVWAEETNSIGGDQLSFVYSFSMNGSSWIEVTRDVIVDVSRALSTIGDREGRSKKSANVLLKPGDVAVHSIAFRGQLTVKQLIIQTSQAHEQFFKRTADWFVQHQDAEGGWSVPVERKVAEGRLLLSPGWYSAMAQGHAMSLLSRAYARYGDEKYLTSALKAIQLFQKDAQSGGVRNWFLGVAWYEEYPTTPGSFVLNGFLYSLLGLYDLSSVSNTSVSSSARSLFETGLVSLRSLLPLFDTGTGSIYDLRHVALSSPPNLARWDYHSVHVYLLKWIVSITGDNNLDQVADRWIGYAHGKRAKHN